MDEQVPKRGDLEPVHVTKEDLQALIRYRRDQAELMLRSVWTNTEQMIEGLGRAADHVHEAQRYTALLLTFPKRG